MWERVFHDNFCQLIAIIAWSVIAGFKFTSPVDSGRNNNIKDKFWISRFWHLVVIVCVTKADG